ncbi:hypothetical protein CLV99_0465, partial [Sphingobacterium yanglingense]
MKRKYLVLSLALTLLGGVAVAQQKLSDFTDSGGMVVNPDAILDLASKNKGLLHTRVELNRTSAASPLSKHVAGMMVYNTATINDVVQGIYYNDGTKWVLVSSGKATNISYNPTNYMLSFIDDAGNPVSIDFKAVVKSNETVTTLVNNGDGTITYTNEKGVPVTINLAAGPKGDKGDTGFKSESQPGQTGAPGTPGEAGGPGAGVTVVHNDSGVWIYDPTTNSWTNILGPKGDKGDKGDAGVVGVQGMPGTSGTPGTPGSGTPGAPGEGITVVHNDSGVWVYDPTTNNWTNILGPKGDKGDKGDAGVVGVQGMPGTSGTPGTPGSGTPGAPGEGITVVHNDSGVWVYDPTTNNWTNILGPKGDKGDKGDAGVVGVQGMPGTSGTPGTPGSGTPGAPGEGITVVHNDSGVWVYDPTTNSWTNILGPKGDKGDKGDAGVVGVQGMPGTSGTPGTPGSGTPGAPGEGITVVHNDSGVWVYDPTTNSWTNILGPKGDKGDKGDAGVVGVQGMPGTSGTPGTPGSGTPGAPGEGITVVHNDSGVWVYDPTTNNWTNILGPKGDKGDKGDAGVVGVQGMPGTSGTPGTPGSGT